MKDPLDRPIEVLINLLVCAYAGLLAGVSFLATMVKFEAKSLSLGQLLEVGHHTFHRLHSIEAWLLTALILLTIMSGRAYWRVAAVGFVGVIWCAQHWVLLPVLDQRTMAVIAGSTAPASWHHIGFAVLEGFKLAVLLAAGWVSISKRYREA